MTVISKVEVYNITTFEDPVLKFIREHPNSSLPPWGAEINLDSSKIQSDLKQVKEDLVTKISELKVDGEKLRTSIEYSSGATQTQINTLKTQVFQKMHEMQNQVCL